MSKHHESRTELFNNVASIKSRHGRGWGLFVLFVLFAFGHCEQAPVPLPTEGKTANALCNFGLAIHRVMQCRQ